MYYNGLMKFSLGQNFWKKFFCMFFGILFMGFFLSFLIMVNWGSDPYTFQNKNICSRFGISLGNWQLAFNAILFIFVLIADRKLIGFGTIFNWVMIGYTADFFCWLWKNKLPPEVFSGEIIWLKIIIFAIGILGFVISASFYMNAQLGLSPYDAVAMLWGRLVSKRIPSPLARIIYDLTAVLVGILITIGTDIQIKTSLPGSIILGLTLGPMISIVGKFMNTHILKMK